MRYTHWSKSRVYSCMQITTLIAMVLSKVLHEVKLSVNESDLREGAIHEAI